MLVKTAYAATRYFVMTRTLFLILAAAALCAACSKVSVSPIRSGQSAPANPTWSYEGENGPENWSSAYLECAGRAQSPIDVSGAEEAELEPLEFTYLTVAGQVIDTSYAVHVTSEGGTLQIGDRLLTLQELHFHTPSEHTIDGQRFDAAVHLLHADEDSQLVIVELPFILGDENEFVGQVLDQLELAEEDRSEVDIEDLELEDAGYYTYNGSMTTPPCSQGVRWVILSEPATLSVEQLGKLAAHHPDNIRPLQQLHDRTILRYSR
jgi:carbonic anhydrase